MSDVAASWPTNPDMGNLADNIGEETLVEAKRRCAAAIKILVGDHHSSLNDIVAATAADMAYRLVMSICEFIDHDGARSRANEGTIAIGTGIIIGGLDPAKDELGLRAIFEARRVAKAAFFAEEDLRAKGRHPQA